MMTLVRLLAFLIGNIIPNEDNHWETFLIFWDICAVVTKHEMTKDDATYLAWLVEAYLEAFKGLYGAKHITPKTCHLVHLPEQILRLVLADVKF